jgi:hypothetical protein
VQLLEQFCWDGIAHSPYSPDLMPSNLISLGHWERTWKKNTSDLMARWKWRCKSWCKCWALIYSPWESNIWCIVM